MLYVVSAVCMEHCVLASLVEGLVKGMNEEMPLQTKLNILLCACAYSSFMLH